ncbi:MAG: sulfatase [Acidobacteriota bacterium]
MIHRRYLKLLLLAFAVGATTPACIRPAPAGPSILLISIDTLRADHVGAYGYERNTTPHLDQLAARGALFELAIAQSNWTVPSVASLLTSLYPSQHGAGLSGEPRVLEEMRPRETSPWAPSIAVLLSQQGYRTGLFSANPYLRGSLATGFQTMEASRKPAPALTDQFLEWIETGSDQPFFALLQYIDLHVPLVPPAELVREFLGEDERPDLADYAFWSHKRVEDVQSPEFQHYRRTRLALYDAALRSVDREIGRALTSLHQSGRLETTLVVITSDHGEEFWDHVAFGRLMGKDPRRIWGVGHGHTMFQELIHVPLILAGPGIPSNRRIPCGVRLIDVAPTLLDLIGQALPKGFRGLSLRGLLPQASGWSDDCPDTLPLIAESVAYGLETKAVIWNRMKLVRRSDGMEMLFDLSADPLERRNLAPQFPEMTRRLQLMLQEEIGQEADFSSSRELQLDEETLRQLRSLGYVK